MPGGSRSDRPDRRRDRKISTSGRRRYWAAADGRDPDLFWIDPDEVHHVRDVMRLRSGDRIELLDGSGAGLKPSSTAPKAAVSRLA